MLSDIRITKINSNDYYLAVKTMLEEVINYFQFIPSNNQNNSIIEAFTNLKLTEFAGLEYFTANFQKQKELNQDLETLLAFELKIPSNFDLGCNQDLELTLLFQSEYCTDIKLKQNKLFDIFRYTLKENSFFWQGEVATDIDQANTNNLNASKYRITNFSEIDGKNWVQSQFDTKSNYIFSTQTYKFKIFKIT